MCWCVQIAVDPHGFTVFRAPSLSREPFLHERLACGFHADWTGQKQSIPRPFHPNSPLLLYRFRVMGQDLASHVSLCLFSPRPFSFPPVLRASLTLVLLTMVPLVSRSEVRTLWQECRPNQICDVFLMRLVVKTLCCLRLASCLIGSLRARRPILLHSPRPPHSWGKLMRAGGHLVSSSCFALSIRSLLGNTLSCHHWLFCALRAEAPFC